MSKSNLTNFLKKSAIQTYESLGRDFKMPNKKAFDFFEICSEVKINFTSARQANIRLPTDVLKQAKSSYTNDLITGYGRTRGRDFALEKCAEFFQRNDIKCTEKNISMTSDILYGIAQTYDFLNIRNDQKILVPTPTFGYYFQQFQDKEIGFQTIPTTKENSFLLDPDDLEIAIKKTNSRVLLLCYPNNPTSTVMTQRNAEEIAEVVKQNNIFVISDEVFMGNILNPKKKHFPIAAIDGMLERSLTFSSISKMLGLPGIRTSFCVGAEDMVRRFARIGGYSDQEIIAAALENSEENREYLEKCRQEILKNIELVKIKTSELNQKFCEVFGEERFGDEAYVKPYISDPEAGLVYLLDFSGLRGKIYNGKEITTGLDIAEWLLNEASIAVAPGECYMLNPEDMLVRIALGHPQHEFEQAFGYANKAAEKIHNSKEIPGNSPLDPKTDRTLKEERIK